jgi:two-component system, LytTR family, response regulator
MTKLILVNASGKRTIFLPTCKGIEVIDTGTIIRIEAISNYSKLFFSNGKTLVVAKVLQWFEQSLKPLHFGGSSFLRIHRTHLINKNFIQQYIKGEGGKVKLLNGELIDVAKRKKQYFLQCWNVAA